MVLQQGRHRIRHARTLKGLLVDGRHLAHKGNGKRPPARTRHALITAPLQGPQKGRLLDGVGVSFRRAGKSRGCNSMIRQDVIHMYSLQETLEPCP